MTAVLFNPIGALRRREGLSQAAFASTVGTSQPTISQYETGHKSPTSETVARMAAACDVVPIIRFIPTPRAVITSVRAHLASLQGIEGAWLFGSYALLAQGEDVVPGDIDVLVVGALDPVDVLRLENALQHALDLSVDIVVISPDAWQARDSSGFIEQVRNSPRRKII